MSDDPIKAASAELQKWLDLLKNYLEKMEALKIQAEKSKLDASRHQALLDELKGMREDLKNAPPDTPGLEAVQEKMSKLEETIEQQEAIEEEIKEEEAIKQKEEIKEGEAIEQKEEIQEELKQNQEIEQKAKSPDELAKKTDAPDLKQEGLKVDGPANSPAVKGENNSVGKGIGWVKGEKGWVDGEGLSAGEKLKGPKLKGAEIGGHRPAVPAVKLN